jgi:phospholipid/cholesterol/gamma-HCH transport system permease protein
MLNGARIALALFALFPSIVRAAPAWPIEPIPPSLAAPPPPPPLPLPPLKPVPEELPRGESPYRLSLVIDMPVLVIGATLWIVPYALITNELEGPFCGTSTTPPCNKNDINVFDRWATNYAFSWAGWVSNGIVYATPVVAFALKLADYGPRNYRGWMTDIIVDAEAVAWSGVFNEIFRRSVRRPRPFLYEPGVDQDNRDKVEATLSYYSGHTSALFALSVAASYTYQLRHPHSRWLIPLWIGAMTISTAEAILRIFSGDHFPTDVIVGALLPPFKLKRIVRQIHFIGVRSLAVVLLTALFTGMVLGLQGYYTLRKFGAEGLLGPAVALSLIRELGPVLTAMMVIARAGSAISAEIGIMRISEQIDALEVMAVNPIKYLVTPRVIAALVALPLLTAIFDVVGIYGGYLSGVKLLGVDSGAYFSSMRHAVAMTDVNGGTFKSISFGILIAWICTYKGFHAGYGAEGVSRATTEAVVESSVLVLVWDYFMTSVLFS